MGGWRGDADGQTVETGTCEQVSCFSTKKFSIRTHSFKREATIVGALFGNDGTSEGSKMTKSGGGSSCCTKPLIVS